MFLCGGIVSSLFAMRFYLFFCLSFIFSVPAFAQAPERPRLVVGIVVDQMRYEYLYRFYDDFEENGLRRMIDKGAVFHSAHYNYAPTNTAPGHASVYAGGPPSLHGIVDNDWYDSHHKQEVYCVADSTVKPLGTTGRAGKCSPKNLITSTITDELRLMLPESKVVAVSLKDRGAVLPAGHMGKAFWYDTKHGNFLSSSYYFNELPKWVVKFNKKELADKFLKKDWKKLRTKTDYTKHRQDAVPYELTLPGKKADFPYDLKKLRETSSPYKLLQYTPFGNTLVTEFAQEALQRMELGTDEVTDFLCVSYSTPDKVGHSFGPYSLEIQDIYQRLDQEIAELFSKLDAQVGKGNYLVFLTADHAVLPIPEYLKEEGFAQAGRVRYQDLRGQAQNFLTKTYGEGDWVNYLDGEKLYLNRKMIAERKYDITEVREKLAAHLRNHYGVNDVFTYEEMRLGGFQDGPLARLARGFHPQRSSDIVIVYRPGNLLSGSLSGKGTSHGSPYRYDTHVPLLFYGWKTPTQHIHRRVHTEDIAPTLAQWLRLQYPSGAEGMPLLELFKND